MAEKKISFGFKLVKKQSLLLPIKIEEKKSEIELIQCLEGQTIKLIHEKEEEKPLVIPLLNSQKTSTALASLRNLKKVLNGEEQNEEVNDVQKSDEKTTESAENKGQISIEQRVIKELLNEAQNIDDDDENENNGKITLPLKADELPLDGAKESSIDDYDKIPITQFGMAMLRGMGLKDEEIKSKQNKELVLRPKGMGLGADQVIKKTKLLIAPSVNETLEIKKNAFIKILGGKFKDLYGQIEGLDDHACRVIVKLAIGGAKEALNEFMVQPVSKKEYQEYGKVINYAQYEKEKRKQDEKEAKKEIKTEGGSERQREPSRERARSNSKSKREPSPRYKEASNSRRQEHSKSPSRDHHNRDRSRPSPSIDRNKTKEVDRNAYKNRHEKRRSRSLDRHDNFPSSSRSDRSRDDKHGRHNKKSRSSSKSSSSDSDSSVDSQHDKRSHHKKSKKKHKKKSSKKYVSSEDDRHIKKKTKKSKRERSRSTGRR